MSEPTVCCVMLVNGREEMVRRAIQSFQAQTYPAKRLLLWDSTPWLICCDQTEHDGVFHVPAQARETIGQLRNDANAFWTEFPIIVHMDSDDWSHPNRIAEQVALLQSSGKQCVGYRDMLFWRTLQLSEKDVYGPEGSDEPCDVAEDAWLYSNNDPRYCLGTSLCYWRETWERRPFPDLPKKKGGPAEDVEWLREVDSLGVSTLHPQGDECFNGYAPRMIASIHGANTQYYDPATYVERGMGTSWKRAAEWDEHCQTRMRL